LRAIQATFASDVVAFMLKLLASLSSTSVAVRVEVLSALGNMVNSGLLTLGLSMSGRKQSAKYPFGFGRAIYIYGLISASVVGGILFTSSLYAGLTALNTLNGIEVGSAGLIAISIATAVDSITFIWAYLEKRRGLEDPASLGSLVENGINVLEDLVVVLVFITGLWFIDVAASFIISGLILVSSFALGYNYFTVLIGRSAPKEVEARIVKIALSNPYITDVNDVRTLVIGPNQYLAIVEAEVDQSVDMSVVEEVRRSIVEVVRNTIPEVVYMVIYFTTPKKPEKSYIDILKRAQT